MGAGKDFRSVVCYLLKNFVLVVLQFTKYDIDADLDTRSPHPQPRVLAHREDLDFLVTAWYVTFLWILNLH